MAIIDNVIVPEEEVEEVEEVEQLQGEEEVETVGDVEGTVVAPATDEYLPTASQVITGMDLDYPVDQLLFAHFFEFKMIVTSAIVMFILLKVVNWGDSK